MLNFIYEWYSSNEDLIAMNLLILLCIHGNVTLVSVIAKGTLIEEGVCRCRPLQNSERTCMESNEGADFEPT